MDKLSLELLALVAAYLSVTPPPEPTRRILFFAPPPRVRIAPLATISRAWQHVVETKTLAFIKLKSPDIAAFAAIFCDCRRRGLLRRLDYQVSLPAHGDSKEGHAANQAAFRSAITNLFALLGAWESELPEKFNGAPFELKLDVQWDIDMSEGPVEFHFDASKSSAGRRYLTLNNTSLPAIRHITKFTVSACPGLAPHPTTMCEIVGATPQLKWLDLEYLDPANKHREARSKHRIALAASLRALNLRALTHLSISRYSTTETYNHNFNCQNFTEGGMDGLNDAVRRLSLCPSLTDLNLHDVLASPDLFRDCLGSGDDSAAIWPNLRRFNIKAGLVSASGAWFYTGDPAAVEPSSATAGFQFADDDDDDDDDDEEGDAEDAASSAAEASSQSSDDPDRDARANGTRPSHAWRTLPDPAVFDPLAGDLARAVLRMPRLQTGHFEVTTDYGDPIGIVFKVAEAGHSFGLRPDWKREDGEAARRRRRWGVWVGTSTEWAVPRDVEARMREWLGDGGELVVGVWPPT
jgi:hypothetical protein